MSFVSIIVPTLNEAENIDILVKRIHSVAWPDTIGYEIIFSDSCSSDTTCERVENWILHNKNIHLVHNSKGAGLSSAVLNAVKHAHGEIVVVIDADLSHPPEKIPEVLQPLLQGTADMVIGSRYTKGGQTPDWPFHRKLSSLLATLPARLLTDVKDPLAGFIATHRERLLQLDHEVQGFKFGLELLATGEGEIRVEEVPIIFSDRYLGSSKMSGKVIIDYFLQLLQLAGIQLAPGGGAVLLRVTLCFLVIDSTFLTLTVQKGLNPVWTHWWSFSLAFAAAITWWLTTEKSKAERINQVAKRQYLGLLWVVLLSVCLRSGVVAPLASDGTFSALEIFSVVLVGTGTCYIGTVFYVFSLGRKRIRGALVHRFYAIGIICYLLLLRLVYCWAVQLLPEEQYYASMIASADYLGKLFSFPAPALTGSLFYQLFGENPFGFRLGGWFCWLVAAVCIYSFARDLYDRSAGFKVLLVYSILPFFFGTGLFLTSDSLLTMFWCLSVYIFYRALRGGDKTTWLWAGFILGFGAQVDWLVLTFIPVVLVFLVTSKETGDKRFLLRNALVGAGVMVATFLPGLLLQTDLQQLTVYEGKHWLESLLGVTVAHSFLLAGVLLAPTGLIAGLFSVGGWFRLSPAVTSSTQQESKKSRLYILTVFCFALLFSFLPHDHSPKGVHAATIPWIVLLPTMSLCAADFLRVHAIGIVRVIHGAWWPTVVICVTAYAVLLHFFVV